VRASVSQRRAGFLEQNAIADCDDKSRKMKGAVLANSSEKLVKLGLVREVRAKAGTPVWRRDESGKSCALKLTANGLKAVAVDDGSDAVSAEAPQQKPEHHPDATKALGPNIIGARAKSLAPRIGSKLATVIVGEVLRDAYADLEQTSLWNESYHHPNPDLLELPGMNTMQARVLGPDTDVSHNVVDALLALWLMNMELYLSENMGCVSVSTGSPIGDCIALKLPRLDRDHPARSQRDSL
jgi:hypothetical protein